VACRGYVPRLNDLLLLADERAESPVMIGPGVGPPGGGLNLLHRLAALAGEGAKAGLHRLVAPERDMGGYQVPPLVGGYVLKQDGLHDTVKAVQRSAVGRPPGVLVRGPAVGQFDDGRSDGLEGRPEKLISMGLGLRLATHELPPG